MIGRFAPINIFYTFQSICIPQCPMSVSSALPLASGSARSFLLWPQAHSSICFWNPFLEYQVSQWPPMRHYVDGWG